MRHINSPFERTDRKEIEMAEDNTRDYVTQEETGEIAPVDQVEGRVEAEMKRIQGSAREAAGQGLNDEKIEREGRELREAAEREIEEQRPD
jgi:uncharacterized protein YjbJ (UPF0337 family)